VVQHEQAALWKFGRPMLAVQPDCDDVEELGRPTLDRGIAPRAAPAREENQDGGEAAGEVQAQPAKPAEPRDEGCPLADQPTSRWAAFSG
jgi:hypothetical protein